MGPASHAIEVDRATTQLPPCVVQVHPVNHSLMLVGTYHLDKEQGTRQGSIDIYYYEEGKLRAGRSNPIRSAVLDLQIKPDQPDIVVSAQSTGQVVVWKLEGWRAVSPSATPGPESASGPRPGLDSRHSTPQTQHSNLLHQRTSSATSGMSGTARECTCEPIFQHQLFDSNTLVLSIKFSANDPSLMSATLSSGEVALLRITDAGAITVIAQHQSHTLECWTSAFGETSNLDNILFSGGDDSLLVSHDLRIMSMEHSGIIWSSMRLHDAGITSILPSSIKTGWMRQSPLCLWTGGYDDQLVSVDLRLGAQNCLDKYNVPRVESKLDLGGGVWRLVPKPWAGGGSRSGHGSRGNSRQGSVSNESGHGNAHSNGNTNGNGTTVASNVSAAIATATATVTSTNGTPFDDYNSNSNTDSSYNHELLACCMYGGARALTAGKNKAATVYRTIERGHDSMVYGGDWIGSSDEVVVCSFYDKQLAVWDMSRGMQTRTSTNDL